MGGLSGSLGGVLKGDTLSSSISEMAMGAANVSLPFLCCGIGEWKAFGLMARFMGGGNEELPSFFIGSGPAFVGVATGNAGFDFSNEGVPVRLGILKGLEAGGSGVMGLAGDEGDCMVTVGAVLVGDNGPIDKGLALGVEGAESPSCKAVICKVCGVPCGAPGLGRSRDILPVPLFCVTSLSCV
jgi:hypothetical protein